MLPAAGLLLQSWPSPGRVSAARLQAPQAQVRPLDGAFVVLVSPKHAANVGAAARSLANFEVSDLRLVSPRCEPFSSEAYRTACNAPAHAKLQVAETLQQALAGSTGSIGFTRRVGATRQTHASIRHLLREFPHALPLQAPADDTTVGISPKADIPGAQGKVGLVFGREESGLTEAELSLCSHACSIPTGNLQPSLNLSHAVCVVLSQLWDLSFELAAPEGPQISVPRSVTSASSTAGHASSHPVDAAALDVLVAKWSEVIGRAGLRSEETVAGGQGNHGRKRRTAGHLRAILSRAQATKQEVQAMHGLANAVLAELDIR
ncbi:hypothetical protein WJX74_006576 [Apatococcus lobatus]|uniref:tRNA/rRNA methyltransferase SpoU type domain-containing protein n=1 Tax=Apatococcus lobatus TaxID=904363 RepID=A0AAW1Q9W9_9CHLO